MNRSISGFVDLRAPAFFVLANQNIPADELVEQDKLPAHGKRGKAALSGVLLSHADANPSTE